MLRSWKHLVQNLKLNSLITVLQAIDLEHDVNQTRQSRPQNSAGTVSFTINYTHS
jgi:hypothetical protein